MPFDAQAAKKAGYSDAEIADYLAQHSNFDAAGARRAGYTDSQIVQHLSQSVAPKPSARPKPSLTDRAATVGGSLFDAAFAPLGLAETGAHVVTGGLGALGGGLTFLGTLGARKLGRMAGVDMAGNDVQAAQAVQAGTQNALTYDPRTQSGAETAGAVDTVFGLIPKAGAAAGRYAAQRTNPLAGAAVNTAINAAPMLVGVRPVRAGAAAVRGAARATAGRYRQAWQDTSPETQLLGMADQSGVPQLQMTARPSQQPQAALPNPLAPVQAPQQGPFPAPPQGATGPRLVQPRERVPLPVKVVRGTQRVVRESVVEPMTQTGRQDAAVRMLARFGMRPEDFETVRTAPSRTGAIPTLPEQIRGNEGAIGAATLMDVVGTDPASGPMIAARESANNAARVQQLRRLAGEGGALSRAELARSQLTSPLYEQALAVEINPSDLSAQQLAHMDAVFSRPAVADALETGAADLANEGITDVPQYSLRALHAAKVALDQRILKHPTNPSESMSIRSMRDARNALVGVIEDLSPGYRDARSAFAQASQPINQMKLAGSILQRGSNAEDVAGNPVLSGAKLGNLVAVPNQPRTIQTALGRTGKQRLKDILTPEQLGTLLAVVREAKRNAALKRAANGPGSATARRLIGSSILDSEAASAPGMAGLLQHILPGGKLVGALEKITDREGKLKRALAEMMVDPDLARQAFERATPRRQAARRAQQQPPTGGNP